MCNLFNLYYLLVLFHLLKVFVSIALVSIFLSLFIAQEKKFKLEISRCQTDGAWELGCEGNGLFLFSSKLKLDGSSSAAARIYERIFAGYGALVPRTITGE